MGRVKKVKIQESTEELLKLMRPEKRPLVQARLQALYLYQSGQVEDYAQIGKQVGYERHTVGKWFSHYREKGLSACWQLEMGRQPGSKIRGQALAELQQKLSSTTDYFTSYKQIQQWLQKEHNIHLSYEHVHRFVRYYLKAKLKVVRKSNLKKDAAKEEKYKKTKPADFFCFKALLPARLPAGPSQQLASVLSG
jgi:transposase